MCCGYTEIFFTFIILSHKSLSGANGANRRDITIKSAKEMYGFSPLTTQIDECPFDYLCGGRLALAIFILGVYFLLYDIYNGYNDRIGLQRHLCLLSDIH